MRGMKRFSLAALALLAVTARPVPAQDLPSESGIDPRVRAVFARAGDSLHAQPRLAFTADIAFEVAQDDGSLLQFGERRRYTLRRPDRLRVESSRWAEGLRISYFDGDKLSVWSAGDNAYALVKLKQHRDVDQAIEILRDRLGIPMPLSELLMSHPLKSLDDVYDEGFYVGEEQLEGVACEHVAVANEDNEIEVWVTKADPPLVQRVHIRYVTLEGAPRFTARLSDWSFTPDVADAVFAFVPPAGAERVRFALGNSGAPPTPEKTPAKKPAQEGRKP